MPRTQVARSEAPGPPKTKVSSVTQPRRASRLVDAGLLLGLIALTISLGAFTLRDTDFWWHLRTGDLIRLKGAIPRADWFTYMVADRPWIDLHWGFQVLISWGYALGGVVALNLAKCLITATAVVILITSRRASWPMSVMVLAWLPAIFVLGGREYVRPETLTLLWLAIDLAVLFRIDRWPKMAYILPIVQVFWVNTQGLFVLGPILIAFALIDAALQPGAFSGSRRPWWRTIGLATLLTGLACLLNPYFLVGALFPIELARTMANPIFAERIAELTPVMTFIERHGLSSPPLQIHLFTLVVGGLSFLVPLFWRMATGPDRPIEEIPAIGKRKRKKKNVAGPIKEAPSWRISPFRLLLFVSFGVLSFKATRNSHQFAAIAGTITAWNFGEWAAALERRRGEKENGIEVSRLRGWIFPSIGFAAIGVLIAAVLSGAFYRVSGEGRVVGLGEDRLWFAHDAARFATGPSMPMHGLVFHNGLASLYDYYGGPDRKVFADARLEVIGPELFQSYLDLESRINQDAPGWENEVGQGGWPVILLDHVQGLNSETASTLFRKPGWRCVWFDPLASVFLRVEDAAKARAPAVDFGARHFLGDQTGPKDADSMLASARVLRNQAGSLLDPRHSRRDLAAPILTLGLEHVRRALRLVPSRAEALRLKGQLEWLRNPRLNGEPIERYRMPFDPIFDFAPIQATYDLLRAAEADPDVSTSTSLMMAFEQRSMTESSLPWAGRLAAIDPINPKQGEMKLRASQAIEAMRFKLGPEPATNYANSDELDRLVESLLDRGRVESAADLLDRAYANAVGRTWAMTDKMATLRLHLGQAARARALWDASVAPPRPAVRDARIAASYLIEGAIDEARTHYLRAISIEPELFEALYGLALLEFDAGRAVEAFSAATRALKVAPGDAARRAAGAIADESGRFVRRESHPG